MEPEAPTRVLIAGGGVAAIEAALALRDLAGDLVSLTIVAPDARFGYRPLSVEEPFALGRPRSIPLADIVRDLSAELIQQNVASIDADDHEVTLADGEHVRYDALLVAVGARRVPAWEHVTTFRGQEDTEAVHGLIQDVEGGYVRRIAFVVPAGVAWPLPLYELALMTAQRAYAMSLPGVELTIVTPEEAPLEIFGPTASASVRQLLESAGIRLETSVFAEVRDQRTVALHPGGRTLDCDRTVALAIAEPRTIAGLPTDSAGFVPVDADGRVRGVADAYAAGDGTSFPVKQGGIACQQADAAATSIAAQAGVDVEPQPFKPVLRGELLTGARPLFLRTDVSGTAGDRSESSSHTLWWPPAKIAGDYLAPYLAKRDGTSFGDGALPHKAHATPPPETVGRGHGIELLGFDTSDAGPGP